MKAGVDLVDRWLMSVNGLQTRSSVGEFSQLLMLVSKSCISVETTGTWLQTDNQKRQRYDAAHLKNEKKKELTLFNRDQNQSVSFLMSSRGSVRPGRGLLPHRSQCKQSPPGGGLNETDFDEP